MRIKMELMSDVIFGNGVSVPGGEDISVLHDEYGFPYYKGTTLKGVFREEYERYLEWTKPGNEPGNESGNEPGNKPDKANDYLGKPGNDFSGERFIFSDLKLSENVRKAILKEIGTDKPNEVLDALTNSRAFTRINENGVADEGSLRVARCVNAGLIFYGDILCPEDQESIVKDVLGLIKWIGTMRNRGFGRVKIEPVEG